MFREYNFHIVVQWIIFKYLHHIEEVTSILLEKQEELEKVLYFCYNYYISVIPYILQPNSRRW